MAEEYNPNDWALSPVPGVAYWDRLWKSKESRGQDWTIEAPEGDDEPPLLEEQLQSMDSEVLKNIRFGRRLGEGGFGQVYQVSAQIKVRNDEPFEPTWKRFNLACKVIRQQSADTNEMELSLTEMKILRYLRHENICNFIEIITIPDRKTAFPLSVVCLFFELCDGDMRAVTNLWQQVKPVDYAGAWVWPEGVSRHWFAQIAKGLEYIHSNDVLHQDINIRNILFRYGAPYSHSFYDIFFAITFKLGDFGESFDTYINSSKYNENQVLSLKREDIVKLGRILYYTGQVSQPDGTEVAVSDEMRDLLNRTDNHNISASEILSHPWLQANTEPRTEPFILRKHPVQFGVYPSYNEWENVRNIHPTLKQDYFPFGYSINFTKRFDPETQQFVQQVDPIQGAPNLVSGYLG